MGSHLKVRVQPRASKDGIVGWQEDALKVRLTAPPVEGAANAALIDLLAEHLGIRRSEVRVVSGETARVKLLEIASLDPTQLAARLPPRPR